MNLAKRLVASSLLSLLVAAALAAPASAQCKKTRMLVCHGDTCQYEDVVVC